MDRVRGRRRDLSGTGEELGCGNAHSHGDVGTRGRGRRARRVGRKRRTRRRGADLGSRRKFYSSRFPDLAPHLCPGGFSERADYGGSDGQIASCVLGAL